MVQLGWMLLGGVLGALGTALLTPRAGMEVRRDLQERLSPGLERGRIRATELVRSGRDAVGDVLTTGKQAAEKAWLRKESGAADSEKTGSTPGDEVEIR